MVDEDSQGVERIGQEGGEGRSQGMLTERVPFRLPARVPSPGRHTAPSRPIKEGQSRDSQLRVGSILFPANGPTCSFLSSSWMLDSRVLNFENALIRC